jgi:hypothetical protein
VGEGERIKEKYQTTLYQELIREIRIMFIVYGFDILLEILKWMIDEIEHRLAKGEMGDSREKERRQGICY